MKKFASFLLVAVLLMTCMVPTIFAAGTGVVADAVTAKSGESVEVAVKITDNTGFKAYGLQVGYDAEALELTEVKAGEKSNGFFDANLENGKIAFASSETVTGDGVLFVLVFKVKTAELGQYDVEIVWDAESSDLVAAVAKAGSVTVACSHVPGAEATCTESQKCTVCGEELAPAKGHTPGAEATCTESQKCTVCGQELAPATGVHTYVDGVCTGCGLKAPANTGDNTAIYAWMALSVVCAALFVGMTGYNKAKNCAK